VPHTPSSSCRSYQLKDTTQLQAKHLRIQKLFDAIQHSPLRLNCSATKPLSSCHSYQLQAKHVHIQGINLVDAMQHSPLRLNCFATNSPIFLS
jgi:hypothetical protein